MSKDIILTSERKTLSKVDFVFGFQ